MHAVGRVHLDIISGSARWGTVDTLRVHDGNSRLVLHLETVKTAVEQEKSKDDGQESGHGARPDDDAPDAVNCSATLLFVQGIEPTSHLPQVVRVVEPYQD